MPSMIKNKIAFLHFKKTGGSWVSHRLKNIGFSRIENVKGLHPSEFHIPRDFLNDDFFTFGFIRNPKDWYISLYCFLEMTKYKFNKDLKSENINELIDKIKSNCYSVKPMNTYFNEFYSIGKKNECNFIGKYESLYNDLEYVLKKNMIDYELYDICKEIEENKSTIINPTKYRKAIISNKNLRYIEKSCYDIIKRFNYEIL